MPRDLLQYNFHSLKAHLLGKWLKKIKQLFQKKNIKENITQNRKFNYVFEKGNLLNQISSTNLRNNSAICESGWGQAHHDIR